MAGSPQALKRELGLLQSTAINMIDMVGIGPFIVLPIVIQLMGGPHFILAWLAGACLSIVDGFIWSELGAAYPKAGGSYNFLKEAYPGRSGKLMSFLYVWQTLIQAPLVAASGAIGFAQYFSYLVPLGFWEKKIVSGIVVILLTALLYRKIDSIGKIGVFLWMGVLVMFGWVIAGAIGFENKVRYMEDLLNYPLKTNSVLFAALGMASVKTIYSYLGYYNVCHLGGEIKDPGKIIPKSIFISIIGIAILYLSLNVSIVSVIPWQEAMHSDFIISVYIEKIYGKIAANVATALILWIAFASLFAVMLGYSRVPYAAAADGQFFNAFAKLHPTKNFPYVSLLALGGTAFVFSLLFKLAEVISAILAMRILVQFIGQAIAVVILRKRKGTAHLPFKMPLYPLPVIAAIMIWAWIFFYTGWIFAVSGLTVITTGVLVFYLKENFENQKS